MTANRIRKAQIRALANLNGLTYVEAKHQLRIIEGVESTPSSSVAAFDWLPQAKLETFATLNKGIPLGTVSSLLPEILHAPDTVTGAFKFLTWPAKSQSKILAWDPTVGPRLALTGVPGVGKTVFAKQIARYGRAAGFETLFFSDRPLDYEDEVGYSNSELPLHEQLEEIFANRLILLTNRELNGSRLDLPQSLLFIDADFEASDISTAQLRATVSRLNRLGRSLGLHCILISQRTLRPTFDTIVREIHVGTTPGNARESAIGSAWINSGYAEHVTLALGKPDSTHSKDNS